ncbi:hypothetical protein L596_014635 [Steinernema carpocapsae]|uniref:non-specific serine/threonine protein kinase n=1 Tax=Steinernema carpocapsae TaxID=34508 RepID=A0A4U5NCN9_STECR|nr:hypothetical protein L596_014635 [Steinernema carpocapsae]
MHQDRKTKCQDDSPSTSAQVSNNFHVCELLGSGSFGNVYAVELKSDRTKRFAMKELTRNSLPRFIATELRILRNFGGVHNVMNLYAAFRDKERVFIVMDYFPHDQISDLITTLTNDEILSYMKNMLIALRYLHSKKIIHRDIKPSNFLYNRKMKRYSLIDFGLAHVYEKPVNTQKRSFGEALNVSQNDNRKSFLTDADESLKVLVLGDENAKRRPEIFDSSNCASESICQCLFADQICSKCTKLPMNNANKAGTPGFRAPEVLLRSRDQTTAIDIWSAGITFLSICARKHPLMRVEDDCEAMGQLMMFFGERKFRALAEQCGHLLVMDKLPFSAEGFDIVKFTKFSQNGFKDVRPPKVPCVYCRINVHSNQRGHCLCAESTEKSISELPSDERTMFEVIRNALRVLPTERYGAGLLLSYF